MTVKTRLGALLATFLVPLCLMEAASAASLAPEALVEKGQLTYGVAASFAPFEYKENNQLVGFDIDLIQALSKKLSLEPKAMNMEFKGLIPALQGSRLDLINSAMYINPARSEQVDFVPYLKIGNQVVVAKGNPAKITGRDDSLCGKTIAVTLGGIQETYARQDNERCTKAGRAEIKVMTLPTAQDSALSLRQRRADVIFDSTPGAVKLMTELSDVFEVVGPEFEANTRIGLAVRKGDAALKSALEAALKEIVADGTLGKLIAKWKFPASVGLLN